MSNTIRKIPKEDKEKREVRENNYICTHCGGNRAEIQVSKNMRICYQCAFEMGIEQ